MGNRANNVRSRRSKPERPFSRACINSSGSPCKFHFGPCPWQKVMVDLDIVWGHVLKHQVAQACQRWRVNRGLAVVAFSSTSSPLIWRADGVSNSEGSSCESAE
eukprot:5719903-Pyramimonas_sp.AAC.1